MGSRYYVRGETSCFFNTIDNLSRISKLDEIQGAIMGIHTLMRKLNSQLEGVIVVMEEPTVHIAQMDSEFDDL